MVLHETHSCCGLAEQFKNSLHRLLSSSSFYVKGEGVEVALSDGVEFEGGGGEKELLLEGHDDEEEQLLHGGAV